MHVPFCASRCGYCDFNTYVPGEGVARDGFADAVLAEWRLADARARRRAAGARRSSSAAARRRCSPVDELARLLDAIPRAPGAEVTVEANPDTVDAPRLRALRRAGVTRLSLGMQSAAPGVLATLERAHTPGGAVAAARLARDAGFAHVSLDLIYGTPGERDADWDASLDAVLEAGVDHVSAYPLAGRAGHAPARARARAARSRRPTRTRRRAATARPTRRSRRPGSRWYEVCNWAADAGARSAHNLGYWRSHDWWGLGPGAHSHVGGVRWWNVLHPARYARALSAGGVAGGRPRGPHRRAAPDGAHAARRAARRGPARSTSPRRPRRGSSADGLLDAAALERGVARLTLDGRLSADRVARELLA